MNSSIVSGFLEQSLKGVIEVLIGTSPAEIQKYYISLTFPDGSIKDPDYDKELIFGYDFIEEKEITISFSEILGYSHFSSKHKQQELIKENYLELKKLYPHVKDLKKLFFNPSILLNHLKLCLTFGEPLTVDILAKDLQNESPIPMEESILLHCKKIWLEGHNKRKEQVLNIVQSEIDEISESGDPELIKDFLQIKEEYSIIPKEYEEKINSILSFKELINYWHPLLLPAPETFRIQV